MHRLFVGIDLPHAVKDALVARMGGVLGARWQSEDQLHLTLRFVGTVDTHTANAVAEALATIRARAFDLSTARTGIFERKARIETLWVGVEPQEPVKALHNKVDRALQLVGIAPELRSYLPHITLARFSGTAGPLDAFLREGFPPVSFTVDAITLFESRLTTEGADYSVVARWPLIA